ASADDEDRRANRGRSARAGGQLNVRTRRVILLVSRATRITNDERRRRSDVAVARQKHLGKAHTERRWISHHTHIDRAEVRVERGHAGGIQRAGGGDRWS